MKYVLTKTNKKTLVYQFETLVELSEYAAKNRYSQGHVELTHNGAKIESVSNLYDLNGYCLKLRLAERVSI